MELYIDIEKARPLIEECIRKFGYAPEHNVDHYLYGGVDYAETIFVRFEDGSGLLTYRDPKAWDVFSEPLAPEDRRAGILAEFLRDAFGAPEIKKVNLELYERTRHALLKALPEDLRARSVNYTLLWPLFDLGAFDPDLPGGRYKDLRNARNAFLRDHTVNVVDARTIAKEELHKIPIAWKQTRRARDRAYTKMYDAYIDNDFRGTTHARAIIVDGHAAGINAGWTIPNSNAYYAAIGLHDYSFRDLGDVLNLEDLAFLKRAGYSHADFAGGEKALTQYKLKFGDAKVYKSFVFSIVKR
ncbi:MAG: hypothetical protein Q8Q39_05960 [bacterium]|nr:hypothetical protein [bacterium]